MTPERKRNLCTTPDASAKRLLMWLVYGEDVMVDDSHLLQAGEKCLAQRKEEIEDMERGIAVLKRELNG